MYNFIFISSLLGARVGWVDSELDGWLDEWMVVYFFV